MILNKKKNAIKGSFWGIVLRLYQIMMPFIIRTVFLYYMGIQYLGLNSLFKSILQILNIAELGVGTSIVFLMYKPIAENDSKTICALMKLYRKYYRIIGIIVLSIGLALLPFLDILIKGDIPDDINLYTIYILSLAATVLSYWLFAYRNSLFVAHQRNDVISKIDLIVSTIRYALNIVALIVFRNYYFYLIANIIYQILNNVVTAILSKKRFPNYFPKGEIEKNEKKEIDTKIKDLFTAKIGQVVLDSFDTVVISAFIGLSSLAVFQNYFYIISSLIQIFKILFRSLLAGIGNSLVIEKQEKNYKDFLKITFLFSFLLNFCISSLLVLYQTFMIIWVKDSDLMLPNSMMILFVIYFLVYIEMLLLELYKNAAGNWHQDRLRPLITAIVNLCLNILLVNFIGLYGILLSTIISLMCISIPWAFKRLFDDIFCDYSKKDYIKTDFYYIITIAICGTLSYSICNLLSLDNKYLELILKALYCIIAPNAMFIIIFRVKEEYLYFKGLLIKFLENRIHTNNCS